MSATKHGYYEQDSVLKYKIHLVLFLNKNKRNNTMLTGKLEAQVSV